LKIIADTNLLVRAITNDDPRQARLAKEALGAADLVAVPSIALSELVWVLSKGYRIPDSDIAAAIRRLIDADNVAVDRRSAEAGLAMLEAGGDFADGAIAFEGAWLGGEVLLSFDRQAVAIARSLGLEAQLLGG
jgi:predicted nucleic-acid-binding protein